MEVRQSSLVDNTAYLCYGLMHFYINNLAQWALQKRPLYATVFGGIGF